MSSATHSPGTPDLASLVERLEDAFQVRPVTVLAREARASGSFPKEIVTCRLPNGSTRRLFCKYSAPRNQAFGHRGGVPYEVRVYRDLLRQSGARVPRLIGAGEDPTYGTWLILEALDSGMRLKHAWAAMPAAAQWLGEFHRENAAPSSRAELRFLTDYDEGYYSGWATRTRAFAKAQGIKAEWLAPVIEHFLSGIPVLLDPDALTVVHGEFTVKNVMVADGEIVPTDWESAAIAAGEVDLWSLVDGCDDTLADSCKSAYLGARWPTGIPPLQSAWSEMAEQYLHFRWLGETETAISGDGLTRRLTRLREIGKRLGLCE